MKIDLSKCKVFAKEVDSGVVREITDNLYFFEEEGIRSVNDFLKYWEVWIEVDGENLACDLTPVEKALIRHVKESGGIYVQQGTETHDCWMAIVNKGELKATKAHLWFTLFTAT